MSLLALSEKKICKKNLNFLFKKIDEELCEVFI